MPKSIYLTDEQFVQIADAARQCGFRVQRGRGSQLAQFVVWASNTACSGRLVRPPENVESKSGKGSVKRVGSASRR